MRNNVRNGRGPEGIMGRTLRQARDRAARTTNMHATTHTGETDGRDGATETNRTDDVRGDQVESRSREGEMESGRREVEARREANDEGTEIAEGRNPLSIMEEPGSRGARDGISHGDSQRTPTEEDSFHTARDTVATRPTAAGNNKAMSKAPSVASPLKPARQYTDRQGRRDQMHAETMRASSRRIEEAHGPTHADAARQHTDQGEGPSALGATSTGT